MSTIVANNNLKIALAQMASNDGDIELNVQKAVDVIIAAAKEKAAIVIFPEEYLTGYAPELIKSDIVRYTLTANDERLNTLLAVCKQQQIAAVIGAPTRVNDKLFISSIVIDRFGIEKIRYNKMNLDEDERKIYTAGSNLVMLELDGWQLGLAICYDSAFGEHARLLAQAGCQAYLVSALFTKGNGYDESAIRFAARAHDNTMYTTMTNYCGYTESRESCGLSRVWDPKGNVIEMASVEKQELLYAEFDAALLNEVRQENPVLIDSKKYQINEMKLTTVKL
ncbi:carbon-nitrogen hydrolase family protein [Dellaglioa algida]|uniref:carbon-nitrogen hydrolase family protein n=1 Tax=Dellaglioa algida TaxID=105612 RepID=UPI0024C49408|nr:carbon-nitrogen hydrolase family protein [Dellaglioa algida]MDK1727793.1 carbon-nitrogen hydrolase family protein [Dellaglioa algida]MDK1735081.1 carbon-nitrogen hydrolase family protein [Dellaglioa algida]MDK1737115.1 carbon-nitrogen hydrolase family protein [Dellaglioa algida]